ncbi:MAG: hypothetical protein HYU87_10015 [Chloroflexi bacterium]|nr:hypothetical protein [Chloroflexota bacterium]
MWTFERTVYLQPPSLAHYRPERGHDLNGGGSLDRGQEGRLVADRSPAIAAPHRAVKQTSRVLDNVSVGHRQLDAWAVRAGWWAGEEGSFAFEQSSEPVDLGLMNHAIDIGLVCTRVNP